MIFILQSCDEWKGSDSMRLVTATVFLARMNDVIADEISNGDMVFDGEENPIIGEERFREFVGGGTFDMQELNDKLEYGMLIAIDDGEVL